MGENQARDRDRGRSVGMKNVILRCEPEGRASKDDVRGRTPSFEGGHAGAKELATYWVGQGVGLMNQSKSVRAVVQELLGSSASGKQIVGPPVYGCRQELSASARITPDVHTFGEPVVATVEVVADAGFIRPDSLRVETDFAP